MFKYWQPFTSILGGSLIGVLIYQAVAKNLLWPLNLVVATAAVFGGILIMRLSFHQLIGFIKKQSPQEVLIKLLSLIFGLFMAGLIIIIARPLFSYMHPSQVLITIVFTVLLSVVLSISIGSLKIRELSNQFFSPMSTNTPKPISGTNQLKVLDTSAIIDGRIADLCKTNFLEGGLIIPSFILGELQKIADSPDPLRRNRGRRGLDLLNKIQKENQISVKIFERDYEELNEVDSKLLRLAMDLGAKVITNDYNLNKVAELYGVQVLNINELSNAIKPVVLPGEEMLVYVLRDGKEYGQGIGYLEDGTMIVVEGGKNYIGMNIAILVTSVLQTSAGRMIFAKPRDYALSRASS